MLVMASMFSCEPEVQILPDQDKVQVLPYQRHVRVGDSITVATAYSGSEELNFEYEWSSGAGEVVGNGALVKYYAPETKGEGMIFLKATDQFGRVYLDSAKILVYKQFVVLKADDLIFDNIKTIPSNWSKFINYVEKRNLKASIGIVGNSLEYGTQDYFNVIKRIHSRGFIEFWNHGHDHIVNSVNGKGEKYHEFKNSSLEFQTSQIKKTQDLAVKKLGFPFRTFGAPGNAIDENTIKAIEADTTLKVWFYGHPSTKLNLARHASCEIEYPVHNPDFDKFKENYQELSSMIVLQIHPNSWEELRFGQFHEVVDFLINKEVTFINPFEYYQLLSEIIEEVIM